MHEKKKNIYIYILLRQRRRRGGCAYFKFWPILRRGGYSKGALIRGEALSFGYRGCLQARPELRQP